MNDVLERETSDDSSKRARVEFLRPLDENEFLRLALYVHSTTGYIVAYQPLLDVIVENLEPLPKFAEIRNGSVRIENKTEGNSRSYPFGCDYRYEKNEDGNDKKITAIRFSTAYESVKRLGQEQVEVMDNVRKGIEDFFGKYF